MVSSRHFLRPFPSAFVTGIFCRNPRPLQANRRAPNGGSCITGKAKGWLKHCFILFSCSPFLMVFLYVCMCAAYAPHTPPRTHHLLERTCDATVYICDTGQVRVRGFHGGAGVLHWFPRRRLRRFHQPWSPTRCLKRAGLLYTRGGLRRPLLLCCCCCSLAVAAFVAVLSHHKYHISHHIASLDLLSVLVPMEVT